MKKCLIIHGTGGHNQENWFPWLKQKLEAQNYDVKVPNFPEPNTPNLQKWLDEIQKLENWIDEDTILVGHSVGSAFILKYLEKFPRKFPQIILVAPPMGIKPIKFYESDKKFLENFSFDWKTIKSCSEDFHVFHSDNDPFICMQNGQKIAEYLNAKFYFIPNSGHFNESAGYVEFPELLEIISEK